MKIDLSGIIKSKKRLYYGKEACYGITRANRRKFRIYLSELAIKDDCLAETILHELLHLWFFIINAVGIKIPSERDQHEVLEQVIPIILSRTRLILERKGNETLKKSKKS